MIARRSALCRVLACAGVAVPGWLSAPAAMSTTPATCRVEASGAPPRVVELYTSEGCNSCPPADRWLSSLMGRGDTLAAAFHVDYWDRLGWRDRFGSARHTERQSQMQAHAGVGFSYTPQVLVDGRDWRRWPSLPPIPDAGRGRATLVLQRDGDKVQWQVQPAADAPARLALWWALLEDGHVTEVKAGENAGATLHHDHVVRRFGAVPPWRGTSAQTIEVPASGEGGRPLRLLAVVTDAANGATLQAAQLRCPG